jgi:hypothetical protein
MDGTSFACGCFLSISGGSGGGPIAKTEETEGGDAAPQYIHALEPYERGHDSCPRRPASVAFDLVSVLGHRNHKDFKVDLTMFDVPARRKGPQGDVPYSMDGEWKEWKTCRPRP